MNFLTPITHPMFERFYKKFDHIFSEPAQRCNFRLYCSGLTLEIKRKNICYINEHIIGSDYQPMQHFMSDAPFCALTGHAKIASSRMIVTYEILTEYLLISHLP
jgi:hypothetical protein